MKHLMLMNSPKKRRKKTRAKAKAKKITRRTVRKIRRKRRSTKATSQPMKRRIKRTKVVKSRKISRNTRSRTIKRPRSRSRVKHRNKNPFVAMLNKDFLMMGAGAVTAPVVTNVLLARLPLPGIGTAAAPNKTGLALYSVGLPLAAAYLLRNKAPSFSQGLTVGAIASGITALFGSALDNVTSKLSGSTGTSAYIRRPGAYIGKTGAYIGNRQTVGRVGNIPPGYSAIQQLSTAPGVFKSDAWKQ